MNKIALSLPGGTTIGNPPNFNSDLKDLGSLFSGLVTLALFAAGFLLVFWFSWGVFQYIFAGGDKQKLAAARARITWAIAGFFITMLAFALSQFVEQIFPNSNPPVTPISSPVSSP